jgi:hypothetical protein
VADSAPAVTTTAAAVECIRAAAAAGQTFTFVQPNPKTGKSRKRHELYKVYTAFAELEALKGNSFPGAIRPVFSGGAMTISGDFAHDLACGLVTFVEAAVFPTEALSVSVARAVSVTRAAPALGFGERPLNRVAARASALPRGPLRRTSHSTDKRNGKARRSSSSVRQAQRLYVHYPSRSEWRLAALVVSWRRCRRRTGKSALGDERQRRG